MRPDTLAKHLCMKYKLLLLASLFITLNLQAQVKIDNSSFEGTPRDAEMPNGWHSCNPGTTPDILPGSWGVVNEASDGNTFMGLITRDNGEWRVLVNG